MLDYINRVIVWISEHMKCDFSFDRALDTLNQTIYNINRRGVRCGYLIHRINNIIAAFNDGGELNISIKFNKCNGIPRGFVDLCENMSRLRNGHIEKHEIELYIFVPPLATQIAECKQLYELELLQREKLVMYREHQEIRADLVEATKKLQPRPYNPAPAISLGVFSSRAIDVGEYVHMRKVDLDNMLALQSVLIATDEDVELHNSKIYDLFERAYGCALLD